MKREHVPTVIAVVLGIAVIILVVALVRDAKVMNGLEQIIQTNTAQHEADSTQISDMQWAMDMKDSTMSVLVTKLDSSYKQVTALQDTLQTLRRGIRKLEAIHQQRLDGLAQERQRADSLYRQRERDQQLGAQQVEAAWQQRYDTLTCSYELLTAEFRGLQPWYRFLYLEHRRSILSQLFGAHRPVRPVGEVPHPDSLSVPQ